MSTRYSDIRSPRAHGPRGAVAHPAHGDASVAALSFALPRPAMTSVSVHDGRGVIVRTLVESSLPAGEVRVCWDGLDDRGSRAPRGTYCLRVDLDGRTLTSRVVEVR